MSKSIRQKRSHGKSNARCLRSNLYQTSIYKKTEPDSSSPVYAFHVVCYLRMTAVSVEILVIVFILIEISLDDFI